MGYETIKKGLHNYFKKHQWKNTTLPDFINCLAEAYNESKDKSMGTDFDFIEWSDSWLKTSGVNILAPLI